MGLEPIEGLDEEVCPLVVGTPAGQGDSGGDSDSGKDDGQTDMNPTNPGGDV